MTFQFPQQVTIRSDEFKFEVDGQDFPWYVDARGPQVERLDDDLWAIGVWIICAKEDHRIQGVRAEGFKPPIYIHGVEFPWPILDDPGLIMTMSRCEPTKVWLKFLARSVDTDTFVADLRPVCRNEQIYSIDGCLHKAEG